LKARNPAMSIIPPIPISCNKTPSIGFKAACDFFSSLLHSATPPPTHRPNRYYITLLHLSETTRDIKEIDARKDVKNLVVNMLQKWFQLPESQELCKTVSCQMSNR
jgi:hypothetical protein